jgi:hypothetical protein
VSTLFDDEELIRARQQRDTAVDVANHAVAKVSRVLEDVAILRDEVMAWRNGCASDKASTPERKQAIDEAMATTDASGVLEDK